MGWKALLRLFSSSFYSTLCHQHWFKRMILLKSSLMKYYPETNSFWKIGKRIEVRWREHFFNNQTAIILKKETRPEPQISKKKNIPTTDHNSTFKSSNNHFLHGFDQIWLGYIYIIEIFDANLPGLSYLSTSLPLLNSKRRRNEAINAGDAQPFSSDISVPLHSISAQWEDSMARLYLCYFSGQQRKGVNLHFWPLPLQTLSSPPLNLPPTSVTLQMAQID